MSNRTYLYNLEPYTGQDAIKDLRFRDSELIDPPTVSPDAVPPNVDEERICFATHIPLNGNDKPKQIRWVTGPPDMTDVYGSVAEEKKYEEIFWRLNLVDLNGFTVDHPSNRANLTDQIYEALEEDLIAITCSKQALDDMLSALNCDNRWRHWALFTQDSVFPREWLLIHQAFFDPDFTIIVIDPQQVREKCGSIPFLDEATGEFKKYIPSLTSNFFCWEGKEDFILPPFKRPGTRQLECSNWGVNPNLLGDEAMCIYRKTMELAEAMFWTTGLEDPPVFDEPEIAEWRAEVLARKKERWGDSANDDSATDADTTDPDTLDTPEYKHWSDRINAAKTGKDLAKVAQDLWGGGPMSYRPNDDEWDRLPDYFMSRDGIPPNVDEERICFATRVPLNSNDKPKQIRWITRPPTMTDDDGKAAEVYEALEDLIAITCSNRYLDGMLSALDRDNKWRHWALHKQGSVFPREWLVKLPLLIIVDSDFRALQLVHWAFYDPEFTIIVINPKTSIEK
ncbi:hypothetical protein NP233_g4550 [Leucocoprinus birnbaumii]|uniref:Uncharacterized protein n=1 Tax=Leucocoprinus birnbaumii TaxID=56174 RepID=A0AAD5W0X8_9AGAR|nr:hypothetical protein NP233_g4550 [Leucocoprinus birnbaumii]